MIMRKNSNVSLFYGVIELLGDVKFSPLLIVKIYGNLGAGI